MNLQTFLELSDLRNVFRARYWKTGFAFWPIHLYSFCLILYMEILGFGGEAMAYVQWILLPVNIAIAGGWMLGRVVEGHPQARRDNFWKASGKLFCVQLVPAFSLTVLLVVFFVLCQWLVRGVPDFSPLSYFFGLLYIAGYAFLIAALLFVPYGVAVHWLYPKSTA